MIIEAITSKLHEARGNACDQVAIGFIFATDWLSGWCEFSRPITEHNEAKFQLTTALKALRVLLPLMGEMLIHRKQLSVPLVISQVLLFYTPEERVTIE